MKLTPLQQKLVAGGVLILTLALSYFGYVTFFGGGSGSSSTITADVTATSAGQDIIDLLSKFQNVSIDPSFFTNALFQNLNDYTTTLPPQVQGRPNPFAPIGSESGLVVPTTPTTPVKK